MGDMPGIYRVQSVAEIPILRLSRVSGYLRRGYFLTMREAIGLLPLHHGWTAKKPVIQG
jgi:hypothetical protein